MESGITKPQAGDTALVWTDAGWRTAGGDGLYRNQNAEQSVIGALVAFYSVDRSLGEVFARLGARDFADPQCKEIFQAMRKLHNEKRPIDLITVDEACGQKPELLDFLLAVSRSVPTSANAMAYANILKAATARRDFLALADNIRKASGEEAFDAVKLTEKVRGYLKNLKLTDGEDVNIRAALTELVEEVTAPAEEKRGIRLGMQHLDRILDGLMPGRLYVIGARPGVGKTVFGIHAALRAASGGRVVAYFNREMEKKDLVKRMAAEVGGLTMDELKPGGLPEDKWVELAEIIERLQDMPIRLINEARTVGEIRAKVSEMHDREELGLIVIDYLQRFRADERGRSRDEEIGIMSNAIKDLALDYKCPVILLSQLNRAAGMVERPTMNQLRESGNIEQDADVVVLLHRPERDEMPTEAHKGQFDMIKAGGGRYLEMIVDKNRHGETGIVPVGFYGARMKYVGG